MRPESDTGYTPSYIHIGCITGDYACSSQRMGHVAHLAGRFVAGRFGRAAGSKDCRTTPFPVFSACTGPRPGKAARRPCLISLTWKGVPAGRATSASPVHIAGVLISRHPFCPGFFVRKPHKDLLMGQDGVRGRWNLSASHDHREMAAFMRDGISWTGALALERAASVTSCATSATGARQHGTRKTTIKFPMSTYRGKLPA